MPCNHSVKISEVIQADLFALHITGSLEISRCLNERGLFDFPITSGVSHSPVLLTASKIVIRSFKSFKPLHFSMDRHKDLDGKALKYNAVSSALKISSFLNPLQISGSFFYILQHFQMAHQSSHLKDV